MEVKKMQQNNLVLNGIHMDMIRLRKDSYILLNSFMMW